MELGNQLNLGIDKEDVYNLLESHLQELSNEELMELHEQDEEEDEDEEVGLQQLPKQFTFKKMAEGFSYLEKALECFEVQDPIGDRFNKVSAGVNDAVACYKIILEEKKFATIQTSINQFFQTKISNEAAAPSTSTK